jgi:lipid A 3-O-deacylase
VSARPTRVPAAGEPRNAEVPDHAVHPAHLIGGWPSAIFRVRNPTIETMINAASRWHRAPRLRHILAALVLACSLAPSARADGGTWIAAALGSGENIDVLRIGGGFRPCSCDWLASIGATPFAGVHVEYWNARGDRHPNDNSWNVGAVFGPRWSLAPQSVLQPFIELGLGGLAVTETRIGTRNLSTALLFDERLAAGIALDPAARYQLAVYAEHRSNGRIKTPNDGLTTYGLELRIALH